MFYYITTFSSTSSTTLYQIVMPENSTLIKSQKNLYYTFFYVPLHQNSRKMDKELINRIKVVLAEKNLTNKWLAEQLDKDQGTVSKWATNTSQPDLKTLIQIAKCLNVGVQDLLREPVQIDNVKVANR